MRGINKATNHTGKIVPVIFLITSTYMVVETRAFSPSSALFPRITGLIVMVGSILILSHTYLPERIEKIVTEPVKIVDTTEAIDDEPTDDMGRSSEDPEKAVFTASAIVIYAILSYLIGILWITPLFVILYTTWFRLPWYIIVILTTISFIIVYSFMVVLYLPVDQGLLWEGI